MRPKGRVRSTKILPCQCMPSMRNLKLDLIFSSFSVRSQNHSYNNSVVFRLARHLCSSTSLVTYIVPRIYTIHTQLVGGRTNNIANLRSVSPGPSAPSAVVFRSFPAPFRRVACQRFKRCIAQLGDDAVHDGTQVIRRQAFCHHKSLQILAFSLAHKWLLLIPIAD